MRLIPTLPAIFSCLCLALWPATSSHAQMDSGPYRISGDVTPAVYHEAAYRAPHARQLAYSILGLRPPASASSRQTEITLFSTPEAFTNAGGPVGRTSTPLPPLAAGQVTPTGFRAVIGPDSDDAAWRVFQHEMFHWVSRSALKHPLPVWLEEGLAEYAGEALFAGQSHFPGYIHPHRLQQLQQLIKQNRWHPVGKLFKLSDADWNDAVRQSDPAAADRYLQAWAVTHYLLHARKSAHKKALQAFILMHTDDKPPSPSTSSLPRGLPRSDILDRLVREYFLELTPTATLDLHAQATAEIFLRAFAQHQLSNINTYEQLSAALQAVKDHPATLQDLPPRLLRHALRDAPALGRWTLDTADQSLLLSVTLPTGSKAWASLAPLAAPLAAPSAPRRVTSGIMPPLSPPLKSN